MRVVVASKHQRAERKTIFDRKSTNKTSSSIRGIGLVKEKMSSSFRYFDIRYDSINIKSTRTSNRHDDDSYKKRFQQILFLFVLFVMHFRSASHSFLVLISRWLQSKSKIDVYLFSVTQQSLLSTESCSSSSSSILGRIQFADFFSFFSLNVPSSCS